MSIINQSQLDEFVLSTPLLHHSQQSSNMHEQRTDVEGLDPPMALAASFDEAPPLPVRKKYSPMSLLIFLQRRTIEHYKNISLSELSGSLGDLGTFIPLTVALARERKIVLAPALFWAGVSNIITGYSWDVPMCVQPMKSISAVALTDTSGSAGNVGLEAQSVTTAGILTGGAVLILGVTNLIEVVNWIVPLTVVCGLQIGVGIRLASKGMTDIQKLPWGGGYDCIGMALVCAILSMFWLRDNGSQTEKKKQKEQANIHPNTTDSEVLLETGANSAASSDEDIYQENGNVEMGNVPDNAHQLDTAKSIRPRPSVSTTAHTNETFDFAASSAPSPSAQRKPPSTSYLRQVWTRACCCLNPFPKTPHPVGIYLFLIGCIFAAVTLATAGPDSGYDLPLYFFGAPVAINAMENVTAMSWWNGLLQGALPQLPLTTLNSQLCY